MMKLPRFVTGVVTAGALCVWLTMGGPSTHGPLIEFLIVLGGIGFVIGFVVGRFWAR